MTNNVISIVVPTYNREKKLKRVVQSIIKQTYKNWELIIVDNYSSDNTETLIENFKNNKIHFYKLNNNGVIAKSRNFGISKSSGQYICFLDSDDWWHKEKLNYVNEYILKGYDFIYHDMYLIPKKIFKRKTSYCRNLNKPVFEDLVVNGPAFPTSSACVKKEIAEKCKGFNENTDFIAWEDFNFWLKISKITDQFVKIPKTLGFITIDDQNFLSEEISIKNIFSFKEKYFVKKKLPNWALFSLARSYLKLKNFKESNKYLSQITLSKLTLRYFIRYFIFKMIIKIKKLI
jgi:glycosyltransferase involved in cell wall biosynthesis